MSGKIRSWLRSAWWLPAVLIIIAAVAVILLNLFGVYIPAWVTIIVAAGAGAVCFLIWKRNIGKFIPRLVMSVLAAAAAVFCVGAAYFSPYWDAIIMGTSPVTRSISSSLSASQAKDDLRYMLSHVTKVHPALRDGVPEEMQRRYDAAMEELDADITVLDFAAAAQEILAPLKDAHTGIGLTYTHTDEPHTLRTADRHTESGDILTEVNGVPVQDMLEQNRDLIIAESDAYGVGRLSRYAVTREGLDYLGVPRGEVTYTWESPNGRTAVETVQETDFLPAEEYEAQSHESGPVQGFVRWELDAERSLATLTLDACVNNEEYQRNLHAMFEAVAEHGIRNVAVDLRSNGGGDSTVADEFVKYLDIPSYRTWGATTRRGPILIEEPAGVMHNERYEDLLFDGSLYVLTSPETFSSAMMFAELVKDNDLGTIIGEAPGNDPNGYGDLAVYVLPNSRLLLQASTKQWHRINDSAEGLIEPDIETAANDAVNMLHEAVSGTPDTTGEA